MASNEECPLCGRELGTVRISEHHMIPKSKKGKDTVTLHDICHSTIHRFFTEIELERYYNTFERLLENEDIQSFVKWVRKKPPEFYNKTDETTRRKGKRWK